MLKKQRTRRWLWHIGISWPNFRAISAAKIRLIMRMRLRAFKGIMSSKLRSFRYRMAIPDGRHSSVSILEICQKWKVTVSPPFYEVIKKNYIFHVHHINDMKHFVKVHNYPAKNSIIWNDFRKIVSHHLEESFWKIEFHQHSPV